MSSLTPNQIFNEYENGEIDKETAINYLKSIFNDYKNKENHKYDLISTPTRAKESFIIITFFLLFFSNLSAVGIFSYFSLLVSIPISIIILYWIYYFHFLLQIKISTYSIIIKRPTPFKDKEIKWEEILSINSERKYHMGGKSRSSYYSYYLILNLKQEMPIKILSYKKPIKLLIGSGRNKSYSELLENLCWNMVLKTSDLKKIEQIR